MCSIYEINLFPLRYKYYLKWNHFLQLGGVKLQLCGTCTPDIMEFNVIRNCLWVIIVHYFLYFKKKNT